LVTASAVRKIAKCGMRNVRPSCDYHQSGGFGFFVDSAPVFYVCLCDLMAAWNIKT